MKKEAIEAYIGKKVSLMLNKMKPDGITCESYIGYIDKVGDSYLELDFKRASYTNKYNISRMVFDLEIIDSFWVYDD